MFIMFNIDHVHHVQHHLSNRSPPLHLASSTHRQQPLLSRSSCKIAFECPSSLSITMILFLDNWLPLNLHWHQVCSRFKPTQAISTPCGPLSNPQRHSIALSFPTGLTIVIFILMMKSNFDWQNNWIHNLQSETASFAVSEEERRGQSVTVLPCCWGF